MFYFCHATGIVQSSWFIFTLQLLKVSSRLSTRNSQVQIVVLWLFLPQPEAFHLNRHEKVLIQHLSEKDSIFESLNVLMCKLKAVYKKFSSADRGAVALLTPAREAFHLNRHEKVLVTFR
jgi:hypothetical protein